MELIVPVKVITRQDRQTHANGYTGDKNIKYNFLLPKSCFLCWKASSVANSTLGNLINNFVLKLCEKHKSILVHY